MQTAPELIFHDVDRSAWVESYILERVQRLDRFASRNPRVDASRIFQSPFVENVDECPDAPVCLLDFREHVGDDFNGRQVAILV